MYIKSLRIRENNTTIRFIPFKKSVNLIVDNSKGKIDEISTKSTNSIGKTTVLKLIDVCLGADYKILYTDMETSKNEDLTIKDYIESNNISIDLVIFNDTETIEITRHLNDNYFYINNVKTSKKEALLQFKKLMFPELHSEKKPSFRQLIKKNIRIDDQSINNVVSFLGQTTKSTEYETLYFALFGVEQPSKTTLLSEKKKYENVIKELLGGKSLDELKQLLKVIDDEIEQYESAMNNYKENEQVLFNRIADELNILRSQEREVLNELSHLNFHLEVHNKINKDLNNEIFSKNQQSIVQIYDEFKHLFANVTKDFEALVMFHNSIMDQKIHYSNQKIKQMQQNIEVRKTQLEQLRSQILKKASIVEKSYDFISFEKVKNKLKEVYTLQGQYYEAINTIEVRKEKIIELESEIQKINEISKDKFKLFEENIACFNKYYSKISKELYNETYTLIYDSNKDNILKLFSRTLTGTSSGKKQGEILCFDFAYILFAREKGISHLDFILNDKKELLSANQLQKAIQIADKHKIQLVFSILSDKLTAINNSDDYIALELSDEDKLFRV